MSHRPTATPCGARRKRQDRGGKPDGRTKLGRGMCPSRSIARQTAMLADKIGAAVLCRRQADAHESTDSLPCVADESILLEERGGRGTREHRKLLAAPAQIQAECPSGRSMNSRDTRDLRGFCEADRIRDGAPVRGTLHALPSGEAPRSAVSARRSRPGLFNALRPESASLPHSW